MKKDKNNLKMKFTKTTNIIILILLIFGTIIWADTNGIWIMASDIRGGTFGLDEQNLVNNFTFINPVYIINSKNLTVNGYITIQNETVSTDNQTITKSYVDSLITGPMANIINCNSQGLFYNGSSCIYGTGVDIIPTDFSFTNVTSAEFNTTIYSNEVTLSGFGTNLFFELKNNDTTTSIIKNGIDTNSKKVSVVSNDKIKIRLLSKNDFELNSSTQYILGSLTKNWSVKTKPNCFIVNGVNNCDQCAISGGIIFSINGSKSVCKFTQTNCPNGWTKYLDWTTTKSTYCRGYPECGDTVKTSSPFHSIFSNIPIESSPFPHTYCNWGTNGICRDCRGYITTKCPATITEIGCY